VRPLKLGAVYRPRGNPDYAYVTVRLEEDQVECLMLWSNSSAEWAQPGRTWREARSSFEASVRDGSVQRMRGT
jgi:hypothetical protein